MRYMSLEILSHLAISDLSREAVKKHQDVVLKALKVTIFYKYVVHMYTICVAIFQSKVIIMAVRFR